MMLRGEVNFFNETGGYGFIESEEVEEDVFFHMETIGGPNLEEGQHVAFEFESYEKGPRATVVERIQSEKDVGVDTTGTGVNEQDGAEKETPGTDTKVYRETESASTDVVDEESPAYCPSCGKSLHAYPDPAYCPGCGSGLPYGN